MNKMNTWRRGLPALVAGAVMIFVSVAPAAAVFAEDPAAPPRMAPERIAAAALKEVTVREKTPVDILAHEERFAVTPGTVITMGDEAISLAQMPVPCTAQVYYETRRYQDAEAVKIVILDFDPGADTRWAVSHE